jgi:hypothetical protein
VVDEVLAMRMKGQELAYVDGTREEGMVEGYRLPLRSAPPRAPPIRLASAERRGLLAMGRRRAV